MQLCEFNRAVCAALFANKHKRQDCVAKIWTTNRLAIDYVVIVSQDWWL